MKQAPIKLAIRFRLIRIFLVGSIIGVMPHCQAGSETDDGKDLIKQNFLLFAQRGVCARLQRNGVNDYRATFYALPPGMCNVSADLGGATYPEAYLNFPGTVQIMIRLIQELGTSASCPATIARLESYLSDPNLAASDGVFFTEVQFNSVSIAYQDVTGDYRNYLTSRLMSASTPQSQSQIDQLIVGNYSLAEKMHHIVTIQTVASAAGEAGACIPTLEPFHSAIDPNHIYGDQVGSSAADPKSFYFYFCNYGSAASSEFCDAPLTEF